MAEKQDPAAESAPIEVSEVDKKKALRWFQEAKRVIETRNYDYGIECYISGLGFWPDAVEEGHKPLRALAMQRALTGGKKPGMVESYRKPMTGKDAKQCMLNAAELLAKDPKKSEYMEALLKNANRGGFHETLKWIAPILLDALKAEGKGAAGRLRSMRETLEEAAGRMESRGETASAVWCYEQAVAAQDAVVRLLPNDGAAAGELRNLTGKLTIARGKYGSAETFRESLRDAEHAKLLHDGERVKQADSAVENLIAAARRDLEEAPTSPGKINALVEHLTRRERPAEEREAIRILEKAYAELKNYNFKLKADDIRLRQLNRTYRELRDKARESGSEEDKQQARLAGMELLQTEIDVQRERAAAYPTDMRVRFKLGVALFNAKQYDEAIPAFQEARTDPKSRIQALFYMGRCFFEKGIHDQACAILEDAAKGYEIENDETAKAIAMALGRAYEAAGRPDDAATTYGRLLRLDYNYADGEVRRRLEALKKS